MNRTAWLTLAFLLVALPAASAQDSASALDDRRFFIGTSAFVLYNLVPDDEPPRFAQLNLGIRLSDTDDLSLEAITWNYYGPIGRPYGSVDASSNYPGRVRGTGLGLAYRRVLWKDVYAALHSVPMLQEYLDERGERIQTGFQLFNTARLGYDVRLFEDRVFVQPSIAVTFWPVFTNLPESFQAQEDEWPSYFLAEPGLHVGITL